MGALDGTKRAETLLQNGQLTDVTLRIGTRALRVCLLGGGLTTLRRLVCLSVPHVWPSSSVALIFRLTENPWGTTGVVCMVQNLCAPLDLLLSS